MQRKPQNIIRRVSVEELRRLFNEGRYTERVAAGELTMAVKCGADAPTEIQGWIPDTKSEEVRIYDRDNNLLVRGHRYMRPGGIIAASGLIDPKRMFINGEHVRLEKDK